MASKVIGLTGGIASGKSTVMRTLQQAGVPCIDADLVVHTLYQHNPQLTQQLVDAFGSDILTISGIDRQKLAQKVFGHPPALEKLQKLVHPYVRQALIQFVRQQQAHPVVVLVIPLLYEGGLQHQLCAPDGSRIVFDDIWLCSVPADVQKQRLIEGRGLSVDEADARLASQLPLEEKLKYNPKVIDCNGTIESTNAQVHQLLANLTAG